MAQVTLSRGSTSVDIELVEESGTQLLSTSFGKPNTEVRSNGGTQNPRVQDNWSALTNFELQGKLFNYADAHALADLVKTGSATALELQIPSDVYPDTVTVAPGAGQDAALSVEFPAGRRNVVDVSLSLTRVARTEAATELPATTPTASGTGPIQVSASGTTVDIPTAGLSVARDVGRPNDTIRRQPGAADPFHISKAKVSNDVFVLAFEAIDDAKTTLNALTDNIFRERLGREAPRVNFNGFLGLGEIRAVPLGSSPFRQTHQAGQRWVSVPTLELRRTFDTST